MTTSLKNSKNSITSKRAEKWRR